MASTPDVHCNAANLRSSLAKPDQVEEDLIQRPLDMEEDDTSLWAGKHRYPSKHSSHGGGRHYGGYKDKHHYGHNKHHYGHKKHHKKHYGHKKKPWYDDGWGYPSHHWYGGGSSHSYGHKKHCPYGYKKKCRRHRRACRCVRRHHWGSEMNEDFQEMVAYPPASITNADSTNESEDVDEGTSSDAQVVKGYDNGSEESDEDTSSDAQLGYGNDWNADSSDDPDSIDTINDNEDTSSDAQLITGYGIDVDSSDDTPQTEESSFVAMSGGYYHHQHPAARHHWGSKDGDEGASSDAQLLHPILHPDLSDASSDDTSSDAQFITGYDDDVDPDSIDTINDNEDSSSDEPDPASSDSSDTDDTQTEESSFVAVKGAVVGAVGNKLGDIVLLV